MCLIGSQGASITHRLRRAARFILAGLGIGVLVVWLPGVRAALYQRYYPVVGVDQQALYAPPTSLLPLGYLEDDPADLAPLAGVAHATLAGAQSDLERLSRLGDLVLSWRQDGRPYVSGTRELGVLEIVSRLQRGEYGYCGHNVIAVSGLWRSLGRDFREVRFRAERGAPWGAGHYGIEAWLTDTRQWVYFDTQLNGFAVDDTGRALSLQELDEHLARGEMVNVMASTRYHDMNAEQLMHFVRTHPIQLYTMRNTLRAFDADHRFGRMNRARPLLARLPSPLDRAIDALAGDAGPRLTLVPAPAGPAPGASLRLSANPGGSAPSR